MLTRTMRLTRKQFEELDEYSMTIPTGKTIGKKWKRKVTDGIGWIIGQYEHCNDPGFVNIGWYLPHILTPVEEIIHKRTFGA